MTLHLRDDTPLRPAEDHRAHQARREGAWKLTPDMRLSRRFDAGVHGDGLANAETTLSELAGCLRP